MKLLATLLIAISLAVGLAAASSAYLVDLEQPDQDLVGLTLNEDVLRLDPDGLPERLEAALRRSAPWSSLIRGRRVPDHDTRSLVAKRGAELDASNLAELRAAAVNRVRVKEFALQRWNERWIFFLALLGLGGGAFLTRRAAAQAIAFERLASTAGGRLSPASELAAIEGIVAELLAAWEDRIERRGDSRYVLARISAVIEDHAPAFVAARDLLVARLGLGGYAGLMDRFAAAERQLHRAWSAAADGVLEETRVCLERAQVVLEETRAALGSAGT